MTITPDDVNQSTLIGEASADVFLPGQYDIECYGEGWPDLIRSSYAQLPNYLIPYT